MKTAINWLVATLIFIAVMAIIGNIDAFLDSRFPDPYEK